MNLIFRVIAKLLNKTVIMVFKVNLLIFLLVLSFGCIEVDFVGEEMSHTTSSYSGPIGDFGASVSISNDCAIIGAWSENEYKGAAYIFKKNNDQWNEHQKLIGSDGSLDHDLFGAFISMDGDYAVVGAFWDDHFTQNAGAAYVYKRIDDQWQNEAVLLPDRADTDFGVSVSISGPYVMIGAPRHKDLNNREIGAVYMFQRDENAGWTKKEILTSPYPIPRSQFGSSVSIDGAYAIIGAETYEDHGKIFIYEKEGDLWILRNTFDGEDQSRFGSSVSIDGIYAVVGAPEQRNENGTNAGSAYIYKRVNTQTGPSWANEKICMAPDGDAYDNFGSSVSIYSKSQAGGFVLIGAKSDDNDQGINAGAAYVVMTVNGGWTNYKKLLPFGNAANGSYGKAVSIRDGYAIIGASTLNNRLGCVYFYK
jgi:hypothetical protein